VNEEMNRIPFLERPTPNFSEFELAVIRRKGDLHRVPFAELLVDPEVIEFLNRATGVKMPSLKDIVKSKVEQYWLTGRQINLLDGSEEESYWRNYTNFYYRLGYDYVPDIAMLFLQVSVLDPLFTERRKSDDTAPLSKGERTWAQRKGVISSWKEFESFPWKALDIEVEEYFNFLEKNLPEGMKVTTGVNFFELVLERLLGYEGLFYLLYDEPQLVKTVIDRVGEMAYGYYRRVVPLSVVGAIFHPDDLGFKTSTFLSPNLLRELVFPWLKKFASLAHQYGKTFWYHCCGYKREIMEDLIEYVGIDALHGFEDACSPVTEFKKRYGDRVGILGGVDMDKLCRFQQKELREYISNILSSCASDRGYALGSGNSIANYVPIENYFVMLEEGRSWKQGGG
jgi:uroporphyrinogen decarboxylase